MRKTLFTQCSLWCMVVCLAFTTFAQNKGTSSLLTAESSGKTTQIVRDGADDLLWDNFLTSSTTGIVSGEWGGLPVGANQTICADDFVVPSGETWTITEIASTGFHSAGFAEVWGVLFWNDAAGTPNGGTAAPVATVPVTAGVEDPAGLLSTPVVLSSGTYWISIYGIHSTAADLATFRWNWFTSEDPGVGNEPHLIDLAAFFGGTGGVFASFTSQGLGQFQNLMFQLYGTISSVPTTPSLVSPADDSTEVQTNPQLSWNVSTNADDYRLQVSLTSGFSSIIYDVNTGNTTSHSLINLAENTKYYWHVNASNSSGPSGYSSPFNFTTVSTVTLNKTINFPSKTNPSDYTSNEYKIVGLPGASNLDVSSILSGTQGTDWEVYWDNGTASDYYVKYNGSSTFRYSTGRSFWIIRKGNLNISRTVSAESVGPSGSVGIQLGDGFNLITNPFTISVDWVDVQGANSGFGEGINTFTGGWSNSSKLEPYIGYLFDNPGIGTLQIPYPFSSTPLEKKTDPAIWRVNVELTCGELFDKTTSFGISGEATEGRDKLDFRKPRGMGNIPFVYFYHPDWDDGYGIFETDIRPEFEEEQTWDLKVYSELRETEKLTFSGIEEIPGEMEIYLVDKDRAKYLNLREESEYEFTPVKNVSEFQILVGKMEKISSKLNNLLPAEFALGNNFPNPFNPVTTIPLSAPQSAEIRLVIYNILGQEVKVLFNGTVEAGKHWYVWDGKDDKGFTVPSGIYVYNFTSDASINISRKMILMK